MSQLLVFTELCPYCQRPRHPRDILHQPGGIRICLDCEHKHQRALDALSSGEYHEECSECGKTLDEPNVRVAIHYEAGKYRLLCLTCDQAYSSKRKELYAGTEYGRSL